MKTPRPKWSTASLLAFLGLGILCSLGLVASELTSERHGYRLLQHVDLPFLWLSLGLACAVLALTSALRWKWVTILLAVLAVPAVALVTVGGALLTGVGRGHEQASPDGRWLVRIDDRGFQDRLYAVVASENSVTGRYWQAGESFWPPMDGTGTTPAAPTLTWTGNDTFELVAYGKTTQFRMTSNGPAKVS